MMQHSVPDPVTPLRVHILIDSLTWGGAEMLLADLAAGAPSAGIELSVGYLRSVNGDPAVSGLRAQGIEPELVAAGGMVEPGAVLRLRHHLERVRPDLVHTHLTLADVLGTLAARSLGLPSVSTIHLLARRPTGRVADASLSGTAKARIAAFVRRHAGTGVIAVSDAAREAYLETGWDLARRVVTVHNGIAREPSAQAGRKIRSELGLEPDALVVSTVTVLRAGKGHDVVFESMRELLPRFPQLRLVVLGDGSASSEIRELARPLGEAAIFTGHRSDVMAVLAATDVLLHPTLMDAFPTALLEAAAALVPVIATSVGGIPEIVLDANTGFLLSFPPTAGELTERLGLLLADAGLRRSFGERAHERFLRLFTAERWAESLRAVYDAILEGSPTG